MRAHDPPGARPRLLILRPPILLHDAALFIDEMGYAYPITNWYDHEGLEVTDRGQAVVAVAGEGACWFTITLAHFPRSTIQ